MSKRSLLYLGSILLLSGVAFAEGFNEYWEKAQESSDIKERTENYTKAIESWTDGEDPVKRAKAYYYRGIAFDDSGDNDAAIEDYNQALKIDPEFTDALSNRASDYAKKGEHTKAIADYSQVLKLDPQDSITFYNRGVVFDDKGDYDSAIKGYNRALKINPQYIDACISRGIDYWKKGDDAPAIEDFSQALKIDPNGVKVYNNRGWAYFDLAEYNLAETDFNNVLSVNKQHWDSILGLAAVSFKQNKIKEAKEYNNKAAVLEPLLNEGMDGIKKLEDEGYYYSVKEKEALKALFETRASQ